MQGCTDAATGRKSTGLTSYLIETQTYEIQSKEWAWGAIFKRAMKNVDGDYT